MKDYLKSELKPFLIGVSILTSIYVIPYILWMQDTPFLEAILKLSGIAIMGIAILVIILLVILICNLLGKIVMDITKGIKNKFFNKDKNTTDKQILHD